MRVFFPYGTGYSFSAYVFADEPAESWLKDVSDLLHATIDAEQGSCPERAPAARGVAAAAKVRRYSDPASKEAVSTESQNSMHEGPCGQPPAILIGGVVALVVAAAFAALQLT